MSRPTLILVALLLGVISVWWLGGNTIRVRAAERQGSWTQFLRGDESGTLAGRILVDEDLPADQVELILAIRLPGEESPTLRHLPVRVAQDGNFLSPPLPCGQASLVALVSGEELLRIEDIQVPASGPSADPRLVEIDLRGQVNVYEFELFDDAGDPLQVATLAWRPSAPEGEDRPYARTTGCRNGRVLVYSTHGWIDLLAVAPGARSLEMYGVSFGRDLHLREGWRVQLRLPDGVDPETDGVEVRARLTRLDPDPRLDPGADRLSDVLRRLPELCFVDGAAEAWLPDPGTWQLEWVALIETRAGLHRLDLGDERPVLAIDEGSWRELVRPSFPIEAYRAELAER